MLEVLGFLCGDGGDEWLRERGRETKIRERKKYILLCRYIILIYYIRK